MASIKFHLRVSVAKDETPKRLFIRMIHERQSVSISLPYKLYDQEWDAKKQQAIVQPLSPRRNYLEKVNRVIREERRRLYLLIEDMEKRHSYTVKELLESYIGRNKDSYVKIYVDKLCSELCQQGKERTARAYGTVVNKLIRFSGNTDITFEDIDNCLVGYFENDMKREGKSSNTISFYMRNLRAIYNKALKEKLFISDGTDIFKDVFTGAETTVKRALTKEEMVLLTNLEITDPGLHEALRIFLFGFFARGMSFVDMAYLKKEDYINGVITYKRKKTKQYIEIKATTQIRRILQSFKKETKDSPYLLPIIKGIAKPTRLQYESALRLQNKRLKILAQMCGIHKTLSTHCARHRGYSNLLYFSVLQS